MRGVLIPVVLLLQAVYWPAAAQDSFDQVVIAGATIPGVFDETEEGPYHAFFRDVVAQGPVSVSLTRIPVRQITRSFFRQRVDCLYMANDDVTFYRQRGYSRADFVASRPFNIIHMRAYTRSDGEVIQGIEQLTSALIAGDQAIQASSVAQRVLPFAQRMQYTPTVDAAFELLASGQVDVAVAYSIDAQQYFARSGNRDFHADERFSFFSLGEGITCWPSARTRMLIEYLDVTVKALQRAGALKAQYGFDAQ